MIFVVNYNKFTCISKFYIIYLLGIPYRLSYFCRYNFCFTKYEFLADSLPKSGLVMLHKSGKMPVFKGEKLMTELIDFKCFLYQFDIIDTGVYFTNLH